MTRLDCRTAMHDAERIARVAEEGNEFALCHLGGHIDTAYRAYNATPERGVARRLKAAIDRMETL